jgi:pyrimidine operon attenuation protein/uracil phosphoribosyltransferase
MDTPKIPTAENLYQKLYRFFSEHYSQTKEKYLLVGIATGGAWLAKRLAEDLSWPSGVISSTLHRDDFNQRGLSQNVSTHLPFEINDERIWLIDDVFYTGRTVRAVLNELFDFGRPRWVRLAVLMTREGHQLPIKPDFSAGQTKLDPQKKLHLKHHLSGSLAWELKT